MGRKLDLKLNMSTRPIATQTFTERFRRRGLIFLMAALRPFLYSTNRKFATRVVHTALRGVTRDRLHYRQVEQTAFHSPVHGGASAGRHCAGHAGGCVGIVV